jgi:AraC family transcriptional regulator
MGGRRLEALIDGRMRSACPGPPLLASDRTAWSGFPLEHNVFERGGATSMVFTATELVLVLRGMIAVEYGSSPGAGGCTRFLAGPGTVTVWPVGHEYRWVSWTDLPREGERTEMLRVHVDPAALLRLAPGDDPVALTRPRQQVGIDDPVLASLVRLMSAEVSAGCPTGRAYGDALALALAAHLAHDAAGRLETPRDGLPRAVLQRVLDYIAANLGLNLTLTELAGVADLSPHHFSLRFKRSVGVPPHQWVTRARIAEAERRLRAGRPVAQVALSLGFASQSHFTEVFRRLTGTTPKRFQRRADGDVSPVRLDGAV